MSARESAALHALLEGVVEGKGLVLDSVVEVAQGEATVVRVVVEAPEGSDGVDSDTLAEVSRAVSKALDDADPIESAYTLEVSTPGAERELTLPRHWRHEIGRLIRVRLRDGGALTGRLVGADASTATIEVDGRATTISYAQVRKARPRVEFGPDQEE